MCTRNGQNDFDTLILEELKGIEIAVTWSHSSVVALNPSRVQSDVLEGSSDFCAY